MKTALIGFTDLNNSGSWTTNQQVSYYDNIVVVSRLLSSLYHVHCMHMIRVPGTITAQCDEGFTKMHSYNNIILSNLYGRISRVVKAKYCTSVMRCLDNE